MVTEHYRQEQVIFQEGEKSQEAYFIVNGLVEIAIHTAHGQQTVGRLGPGEIFGEMGMIMDRPRSATATALENTTVETINEAEFETQIIQRSDRLHVYLATLFERIRKTDLLLNTNSQPPAPAAAPPTTKKKPSFRVRLLSHYHASDMKHLPIDTTITKLPFRLGRSLPGSSNSPLARNDLVIEEHESQDISRNHCEIDFEFGHFIVRDSGSRLGSWVNGTHVSVDAGRISTPLELGENTLVLGNRDSPHRFSITVEAMD